MLFGQAIVVNGGRFHLVLKRPDVIVGIMSDDQELKVCSCHTAILFIDQNSFVLSFELALSDAGQVVKYLFNRHVLHVSETWHGFGLRWRRYRGHGWSVL